MRTVILFHPKLGLSWTHRIPLSLLSIARCLDRKKYDVRIIDAEVTPDYVKQILDALPDAVCFAVTAMTGQQIKNGLEMSRMVKEKMPGVPVVWGGWHASVLPVQTVENRYVDIVVKGQGETTFRELVERLYSGRALGSMEGIAYKVRGKAVENPDRTLECVDDFPPMPYDLLDVERYVNNDINTRTINYISSVGCPHGCRFCVDSKIYKRKWTSLSPKKVIDDLEALVGKFGINGVVFDDNNFFVDVNRAVAIAEGITKKKLSIKWYANARIEQVNRMSDETLALLKRSGCQRFLVGAESGSQKILDAIDKKTTVEDIVTFAKRCGKFGIIGVFSFMVGLPDQDIEEDFGGTFGLVERIKRIYAKHEILVFFYSPFPGTPMYELAVSRGFKEPASLEEWSDFDLLTVSTPWVDKRRFEKIINFYLPMAFPRENFMRGFRFPLSWGFIFFHQIARLRWKYKAFSLPLELWLFVVTKKTLRRYWSQQKGAKA
jgi:anaerobic magnesium-protoporphyrin IX monomethyl ester cyclase